MDNIWQKYAKVLVEYSTDVKKDDFVIIRAESQAQPLIKAVYEEVLKKGDVKVFWLQLGIINNQACAKAHENGIIAVQNRCTKVEYERLMK